MTPKTRILIADDHQIVRMGLMTIFSKEDDLEVIGEARNGLEAVRLAHELKPDVTLMDLMMPKLTGADAVVQIRAENPEARILVLTTFGESADMQRALDAGALGALIKDTPHTKLVAAIRTVAKGRRVISPEILQSLTLEAPKSVLSERQCEILKLVAQGLTTKAISDKLDIGPDGVNAHLRTIFAKLGANSRTEAVVIAMQQNLLK